ncbi:MAG: arylamine N-acetyltransferase [Rhodothermales bacterium]|nr:arylamine N-acetyltransferase [Rhodothermales bacterium]
MERSEIARTYLKELDVRNQSLDLEFLTKITRRHVSTFAFSSVACQLGEDLPLDLESLFDRIVTQRRGGYCFEQNGLLFGILEELGYRVELYLARVIYNKDVHPGLTHRITLVELNGLKYVADVGFGPLGPAVPVLMSEQETKDDGRIFRIAERHPREYHMQVLKEDGFFSLYRFDLVRYGQADCELGHFFSHKHPNATFVNHLVVSRIIGSEVRSLRDLEYWVSVNDCMQKQRVRNADGLQRILRDDFGIRVTDEECRTLYERSNRQLG